MNRGRQFRLDRRNKKIAGVCAGIGNYTGIDPLIIRIGVVLVTLLGAFPWTLLAYGLAAWLVKSDEAIAGPERAPSASTSELREKTRDIDRRMAEIDSYVAAQNSRLSAEIDSLR